MNKEQITGLEKKLNISVSPLAKDLVEVATAFCWQPLKIENGILVLGIYEKDPLRLIENNAKEIVGRRTNTGHIEFLQIDLERDEMSEVASRFIKERIVSPLNHTKYGEKAQVTFNEAKEALVVGNYERSAEKVRMASRGNPNYNNKQNHINEKIDVLVSPTKSADVELQM